MSISRRTAAEEKSGGDGRSAMDVVVQFSAPAPGVPDVGKKIKWVPGRPLGSSMWELVGTGVWR